MTHGAAADRQVSVVLSDLAQDVVTAVAPAQADLLRAVTARWRLGARPGWGWGWLAGSVGVGAIDPQVVAQVIYPLLTGTLAQVLGTAVFAGLRRKRGRRGGAVASSVKVTLTAEQVEAFRSACVAHGIALGVPKSKAQLYADAAHGALVRALAEPAQKQA